MSVSPHIRAGFEKVKLFESQADARRRPAIQLAHLMDIANHEQGVILQPLIYDNEDFAYWVRKARGGLSWVSPNLELAFSSECDTKVPAFKSLAPEGTKMEDLDSRMGWIQQVAQQFHGLMINNKNYMEGELKTMAGWVNQEDGWFK